MKQQETKPNGRPPIPGELPPAPEVPRPPREAVTLDEASIQILAGLERQFVGLMAARSALVERFKLEHKLEGPWTVAQNGRDLVKGD